jgi:UDP-glucuronate 4-epimerase
MPRSLIMRAIVTGAAGFIGSHLSERLVAEGWDVIGVDAFTEYYDRASKEANLAALVCERAFDLVEGDVATLDLGPLLAARPLVFHLAAQPGVRASFGETFAGYVHHNLTATQRLFDAALVAGCPRVVWASSSSVYGDAEAYPCLEHVTPLAPRSPYGVTKRAGEDLARIYIALGLDVCALRYFTVYGPRQRPDMAMRRLCETAVTGARFELNGDGMQSRDFTYVADAVDATLRAGTVADAPPIVNVGGGQEATMRDVIEIVTMLADRELNIASIGAQRGDVRRTAADTTVARQRLHWEPHTPLLDGLRNELDWVCQRVDNAAGRGSGERRITTPTGSVSR